MELTFDQCKQFLKYLIDIGILTSKEESDILDKIINQQKRCLFLLADFLKRLTPSDCYDVALRVMQIWNEKQSQKQVQQQEQINNIQRNHNAVPQKKEQKLPTIITEEEIEETQYYEQSTNEGALLKQQQRQQQEIQKQNVDFSNHNGLECIQLKQTKDHQLNNTQECNSSNNHSLPQTFYQTYYKPSYQQQTNPKQGEYVQKKKRMDRTFVNEQFGKISQIINSKKRMNLKFSFQILKNFVLKQKLNNTNSFSNTQYNSCIQLKTTNNMQTLRNIMNEKLNNSNSSQSLGFCSNNNSNSNYSYLNFNQNQREENTQNNVSQRTFINQALQNEETSQQSEQQQAYFGHSNKVEHSSQQEDLNNSKDELALQQQKYQNDKEQQKKKSDSLTINTSNNSSVSYQNNHNNNNSSCNNIPSYGNSFQQSYKSEENKVCTFRPRSTLISPTNATTVQFNFSAFNSANATPELFNRQLQFQHPEQIMEYSPSPTSTVNLQFKSGSFLQSSSQNQDKYFEDLGQQFDQPKHIKNEFELQEDLNLPSRINFEQRQLFDKDEDELNQELYRDLGFHDQIEGYQKETREGRAQPNVPYRPPSTAIEGQTIQEQSRNTKQYLNPQNKDFNQQIEYKNNSLSQQQHQQYSSNVANQPNFFGNNLHNYSHISKNLDDSTSITFDASLRSFTKQQNGQRTYLCQGVGGPNQMNSFLMQSQDIFSTRQNQNVSKTGEQQLGISQLNPFMSEVLYSNIKHKPEYQQENNQSALFLQGGDYQSSSQKPMIILEDDQDQLLISSTTENCSIQNQVSSLQSSFQQQGNGLFNQTTDYNETQKQNNNQTQQQKLDSHQNNKTQIKQQDFSRQHPIYIQNNESHSQTEEDSQTTNTFCQNSENTLHSLLSTKNHKQLQNDKQKEEHFQKYNNSNQRQHSSQLTKDNKQDISENTKVPLYSFEDEDIFREELVDEQISTSQQPKNEVKKLNGIPNKFFSQAEQPEQTQNLLIQPEKHDKEKFGDVRVQQQSEKQSKDEQKLLKSKTTFELNNLYIDFEENRMINQNKNKIDPKDKSSSKPNSSPCEDNQFSNQRYGNTIHDKLYSQSKVKEQGQQLYQSIKLKQELKDCTFIPQLIAKQRGNSFSSTLQKNNKTFLDKDLQIQPHSMNITFENKENSFKEGKSLKPLCSSKSYKGNVTFNSEKEQPLQKDSQKKQNVFDKLYKDNQLKIVQQCLNQIEKEENELNKCTFKPQICEQSNRISKSKSPTSRHLADEMRLKEKSKTITQFEKNVLQKTLPEKKQQLIGDIERQVNSKQMAITKNRSFSSQQSGKKSDVVELINNKENAHQNSITPYIEKKIFSNDISGDVALKKILSSPKNVNMPKKVQSPVPILKGCIDPRIDQYMKGIIAPKDTVTNINLPFNQSMPITPSLNQISSNFDSILSKKFKLQNFGDYNSIQTPNYSHKLTSQDTAAPLNNKGAQSVKLQKHITFNSISEKDDLESLKRTQKEEQNSNSGSPLIQNNKYFQDDIIDESKMEQISNILQPKDFHI